MKPKITQKLAKEIVSKNPDAVRLIDYSKSQGWDVYYGSDNKKNPWPEEYDENKYSTCGIDVVSVGNGKKYTDFYFSLFVYEKDDKSGLPDNNLSKQLQINNCFGDCWMGDKFDGWIVDDIIVSNSTYAIVDGKKYDIWETDYDGNIELGRVKDDVDEDEAEEEDWEELNITFDRVEKFV